MILVSGSLEPYPHPKYVDLWRVPLQKLPPEYILYIGKDYSRLFTDTTLPVFVKSKLAMADAEGGSYVQDDNLYEVDLFTYKGGGLGEIGWKASDTMYIVVLHESQLEMLKGIV